MLRPGGGTDQSAKISLRSAIILSASVTRMTVSQARWYRPFGMMIRPLRLMQATRMLGLRVIFGEVLSPVADGLGHPEFERLRTVFHQPVDSQHRASAVFSMAHIADNIIGAQHLGADDAIDPLSRNTSLYSL